MIPTDRRLLEISEAIGVSRLADVTGFDRIGIPVVMAIRPNSRGYCVAQGKGLTPDAARRSGLFEACEGYHAENITKPLRYCAFDEFTDGLAVPPNDLARVGGRIVRSDERFLWIEGQTIDRRQKWVPFECVHTDYSLPNRAIPNLFMCSSNGLAAGANWRAAALHGALEVIERDCESLFVAADEWTNPSRRINLDWLDDGEARNLVEILRAAKIQPFAWNLTSDLAIPAVYVTLVDLAVPVISAVKIVSGSACRPASEDALLAALLEAIQSRATVIAGTRDDLFFGDYLDIAEDQVSAKLARLEVPGIEGKLPTSFDADFATICKHVEDHLQTDIVCIDLSREIKGVAVVRTIIPKLEGVREHSQYQPGKRAKTLSRSTR